MSDATPLPRLARRPLLGVGAAGLLVSACATVGRPAARQTVWTFDRLSDIGGERTMVEGGPALIDSPYGQAVLFDGVDDALFIDRHPLAGAQTFTFEALFRPDGGAFEQRWFHLAEEAPAGQPPSQTRFLFEIRVVGDRWYLDAFTRGPESLLDKICNRGVPHLARGVATAEGEEEELQAFAAYLGILEDEPDLIPVARSCMLAPMPSGWTECFDAASERPYFHHAAQQITSWKHPLDETFFEIVAERRAASR